MIPIDELVSDGFDVVFTKERGEKCFDDWLAEWGKLPPFEEWGGGDSKVIIGEELPFFASRLMKAGGVKVGGLAFTLFWMAL